MHLYSVLVRKKKELYTYISNFQLVYSNQRSRFWKLFWFDYRNEIFWYWYFIL